MGMGGVTRLHASGHKILGYDVSTFVLILNVCVFVVSKSRMSVMLVNGFVVTAGRVARLQGSAISTSKVLSTTTESAIAVRICG